MGLFDSNESFGETPPPKTEVPAAIQAQEADRAAKANKFDDDDDSLSDESPRPSIFEKLTKDKPAQPEDSKSEKTENVKEATEASDTAESPEPDAADQVEAEDVGDEAPELADEQAEQEAQLTPEDEQTVAADFVDERNQEIPQEREAAEPGSEDHTKAKISQKFNDELSDALLAGATVDEALDAATARTFEHAGMDAPEDMPETPDASESDAAEESEFVPPVEDEPSEPEEADRPDEATEEPSEPTAPEDTEPTDPDDPTVPPVPPTPPTSPTPPGGSSGGSGSGSGYGSGGGRMGVTGNTAPNTTNLLRRFNAAPHVLAGGLVGYLLGRRRGRLKTEARLLPVQRKLEKQVSNLQRQIAWREMTVRNSIWEQMHAKKLAEAGGVQSEKPKTPEQLAADHAQEQAEREKREQDQQSRGRIENFEKQKEHSKAQGTLERLAFFKQLESDRPPLVETMTMPKVLEIAQKILVEDSNVRKLYESNRLDDKGLRRVVEQYLRGERYDRTLRENLLTPNQLRSNEAIKERDIELAKAAQADQDKDEDEEILRAVANHTASSSSSSSPGGQSLDKILLMTKKGQTQAKWVGLITGIVVSVVAIMLYLLK